MLRITVIFALAVTAPAQPDPATGKKIFESQCALCHGQTGGGGRGPSLTRPALDKAPDDKALRQVISNGIPPEMPGAWQLHEREVEHVAAYVRSLGAIPPEALPGNSERGARVFESLGCGGCHIVGGKGEGFGPELSNIGARRNAAHLRKTVLDPASSIPDGFVYVLLTTTTGDRVRGIRLNEDTFTIQIKDASGRFHSFRKSEAKELVRMEKQTPMPSYRDRIAAGDLDDLIAYLAGLRGKV